MVSRDEALGLVALGTMRARDILAEHHDKVTQLAEHLIEVRQVDAVEFRRLMMAASGAEVVLPE
jgi:ATP-dependent Zn protease